MEILKISNSLVASILHAARATYPDEFLALLGGEKEAGMTDELVMVPAIYGRNFSSLRRELVPFDSRIIGSVHSHPSESNEPSAGDLASFARLGYYHLIVAYPYQVNNMAAYDARGKRMGIEVVEVDPNFI